MRSLQPRWWGSLNMEDTGAEVPPPGEKALSWGIQAAERGWCTAGKRLYKQRVFRSEREGVLAHEMEGRGPG